MADISIACDECNRTFLVSEFADTTKITCPSCGKPVGQNVTRSPKSPGATLQLKKNYTADWKAAQAAKAVQVAENNADPQDPPSQSELMKGVFAPGRQMAKQGRFDSDMRQILLTWLVFTLTGFVFFWLRYGKILPSPWIDYLRDYGWTLVVLAALATLTAAFAESLMQGVLCVLIPGYFLYYLLISDRMYLRAITFGMLCGVGPDTLLLLRTTWLQFYESAMTWILSGGA